MKTLDLLKQGKIDIEQFDGDFKHAIEELSIYKAELETQNQELNTANKRVQREATKNRAIFEEAPLAYVVIDELQRVIDYNKQAKELLKFIDILEKPLFITVYNTITGATTLASWLSDDDASLLTLQYSSEPVVWHQLRKKYIPEVGYLMSIDDVTSEVTFKEQELRAQVAEKSDLMKSNFLATMSHEVRTPLTGIMGFIDLLHEENMSADMMNKVKRIQSSATSLLNILNDILDVSKLNAGKMSIHPNSFDIRQLIEDCIHLYETKLANKKINIFSDVDDEVPTYIRTDSHKLRQIINNLLSNAVKFTQHGEIVVRVSVDNQHNPPSLRVSVRDTGVGIPEQSLKDLFAEFSQVGRDKEQHVVGTGLGLAISKKLVELLGGEIHVNSTLNEGSTFSFHIKFTNTKSASLGTGPSFEAGAIPAQKILVVEDNQTSQLIIKTMLTKWGHEVHCANNGEQAVELATSENYDLIIMDNRMPVMSGLEATQAIRCIDDETK
jgi:signal transduction histidine kinase